MVEGDRKYISDLLRLGVLRGPVLELGAGYGGQTCREIIAAAGLKYFATDLTPSAGVDFVADFERIEDMRVFERVGGFSSILILNVLEHAFEPLRILDNALTILRPDGNLVVLTPAVWPLHRYPRDIWRLMPDFYEEYARRRGVDLAEEHFVYVGWGPTKKYLTEGGYDFPPPRGGPMKRLKDRAIHRLFNTAARGMMFPSHIIVAAVFNLRAG